MTGLQEACRQSCYLRLLPPRFDFDPPRFELDFDELFREAFWTDADFLEPPALEPPVFGALTLVLLGAEDLAGLACLCTGAEARWDDFRTVSVLCDTCRVFRVGA